MRIRLGETAASQIREADAWWREHRAQPDQLRQEVTRALELLRKAPYIGARDRKHAAVRRFYLRRVRHFLYYRINGETLDVLAFWHDARGTSPLDSP